MINKKKKIKELESTVARLTRITDQMHEDYIVLMNAYIYLANRLDELCATASQEVK